MTNFAQVIDLPATSYSERVAEVGDRNLDKIVSQGARAAQSVIEHVLGTRPRDALVKAPSLDFALRDDELFASAGASEWTFHDNAFGQLCDRVSAPRKYLKELRSGALQGAPIWQRNLLVDILNEHGENTDKTLLFRDINGEARGVLSNAYKRLNAAPLLETFFAETRALGAVPSYGFYNDVRFMVRAIYPKALRVSPTEVICIGIQFKTSDFGAGVYELDPFAFRTVCLNTAQFSPALSHKHLGAQISPDVLASENTVRLDTEHARSASVDVIKGVLSESSKERIVSSLRNANETDASFSKYRNRIEAALGKGLSAKVEEAFESNDVINLPPEKTVYRLSNALTWIAQHIDNADTADSAERLAGKLLAA